MALLARSTGLNERVGTGRRRKKNQEKQARDQRRAIDSARNQEIERQNAARRQAMEQEVFATTEGQGIQEQASISLGFDDEDEDDLFDQFSTGLMI